jgi:hypothetical protein
VTEHQSGGLESLEVEANSVGVKPEAFRELGGTGWASQLREGGEEIRSGGLSEGIVLAGCRRGVHLVKFRKAVVGK